MEKRCEIWRIPSPALAELLAKEVGLTELEVLGFSSEFSITGELLIKVYHKDCAECYEGERAPEYHWKHICGGKRGEIEVAGRRINRMKYGS